MLWSADYLTRRYLREKGFMFVLQWTEMQPITAEKRGTRSVKWLLLLMSADRKHRDNGKEG